MKLTLTTTLAAVAMIVGSMTAFAMSHAHDIVALKDLHVAFHQAMSHAADRPMLQAGAHRSSTLHSGQTTAFHNGGCDLRGKGTPGTASCDPRIDDLMRPFNHAGGLCGTRLGIADADLYGSHQGT